MSQNQLNGEVDEISEIDRGEEFFDHEDEQQQVDMLSHIDFYSKSLNFKAEKESSEASFNHNNLMTRQQYILPLCEELRDSTIAVQNVMNIILKKADQMVYNNYIDSILDSHAVSKTLQMTQTILKFVAEPDEELDPNTYIQDREDIEPIKPIRETWVRSQAEVENLKPIPIEERRESQLQGLNTDTPKNQNQTPSRKSNFTSSQGFGKSSQIKKKAAQQQQQLKPHQPVNLEQPLVIDDEEERLRIIQMEKQKRKNNQEEKEKQDQIQQQKARIELKKDLKSKFTYDFQGKIIQQKAVKVERLPPAHHQMGFHLKETEKPQFKPGFSSEVQIGQIDVIKNQQNPKSKDPNNQQQQQQNVQQKESLSQLQNLDQQLAKLLPNTKLPYNEFQPSNGITLYYQQQIKEGPRNQETINTIEDLEEKIRMLQPKEPMQITRSEYQRITEKGNLVAGFKKPMEQSRGGTQNILKDLDTQTTSLMVQKHHFGKIHEESSFMGNHSKTQNHFRKEEYPSSIKVNSTKLRRDLQVQPEEEQAFQDQIKQNQKKQGSNKNINNQKKKIQTPNDDFNLRLMQSPEWGKQKGGGFLPQLPKSQKQNRQLMSQTLNTIYKLPRERDQGQGLKLTKVLNPTKSVDFFNNNSKVLKREKQNTMEDSQEQKQYSIKQNPYNFRGTFMSTHTKFTDTLRTTNYG